MQAETACERGAIAAVIRQADTTIIVACGQRGSNREAEEPRSGSTRRMPDCCDLAEANRSQRSR
jgi:hypothetical protein